MMATLLVIVPDRISTIIAKGEYQPRYYNPGNLFDEVHILMTNDDQVNPADMQRTVGEARLYLHNLPEDQKQFIKRSHFFRPWLLDAWAKPILFLVRKYHLQLLNRWAAPAVDLARQIRPALIRCHGNDYNTYVAGQIKKNLCVSYVVSLHTNPDVSPGRRQINLTRWQDRLLNIFLDDVERIGLEQANLVLPVYQSIIPYLKRIGCQNYEVAYNVLNVDFLRKKEDYTLHRPIRLISVGRHYEEKNPENIIRAVQSLPEVHFTLIGDGSYQNRLQYLTREYGLENRVVFRPALPNDELCQQLPEYDIFTVHNEAWGISKAVLEALLTGLPVVSNRHSGQPTPELQGDFVMLVENTKAGYYEAIHKLINDHAFREQLGRKAYAHAQEHWAPAKTEARYVEIYQRVMARSK